MSVITPCFCLTMQTMKKENGPKAKKKTQATARNWKKLRKWTPPKSLQKF